MWTCPRHGYGQSRSTWYAARWRRRQLLDTILLRDRPVTAMVAAAPGPERTDLRVAPRRTTQVVPGGRGAALPVRPSRGRGSRTSWEVPVGTVKSPICRGPGAALAVHLAGYPKRGAHCLSWTSRRPALDLRDRIQIPDFADIRSRARVIRRRRRSLATFGAAALALVVALGTGLALNAGGTAPAVPPAGRAARGLGVARRTDHPARPQRSGAGPARRRTRRTVRRP